ncbi:hypothetical protein CCACVL1_07635 [Corchorus capsularis]|uniref:Uncharacterized protein n=1 Tax=Corchorus capsularis TaxID=210143 RepID=A0A1R3J4L4_COCAP|nr:hypothetical protein CCACVL1_07635 [Corchorus capsularis]
MDVEAASRLTSAGRLPETKAGEAEIRSRDGD